MKRWFEQWWRPQKTNCKLNYNDLVENPPHNILGINLQEYQNSIDAFRSSELFRDLPPNAEVLEWFRKYGRLFRHIALSAVPRNAAVASASWLFTHFGDWIRTFAFIPSQRNGENPPSYDLTKADYIKWLNKADVFIEDNESNITGLEKLNIQRFIVTQPWNSSKMGVEELLSTLTDMQIKKLK
jgi:hypothetical protein